MNRFILNKFSSNYRATIGANFLTKSFKLEEKTILVRLWDIARGGDLELFGVAYFRGIDAVFQFIAAMITKA